MSCLGYGLFGGQGRGVVQAVTDHQGVPVVIFGLIMSVFGGSMATVIEISNNVYALSLVFWGAYAARAAGLGKWGQVRFGLVYGLLGMTIVIVEYFIVH